MSYDKHFSEKLNLFFFVTPKCGFSSFRQFCTENPSLEFNRSNLKKLKRLRDDITNFFVIVRDPFARAVSSWLFVSSIEQEKYKSMFEGYDVAQLNERGFNIFLKQIQKHKNKHWRPQYQSFLEEKTFKKIRLENIEEEMKTIFGKEFIFPHENKTPVANEAKKDYLAFYDDENIALVKNIFRQDILWLKECYEKNYSDDKWFGEI